MSKYKAILNEMRTILGMDPLQKELELETETVVVDETTEIVDTTEVKLAEATLEDGTIIYYDGEMIGVDVAIFTDEALTIPAETGEYVLENGDTFIVTDGVITEYTPIVVEDEEPVIEEQSEDFEKKYNEIKSVVDDLKNQLAKFEANEVKLMSQIEKLSAEPEVESITQEPQDKRELSQIEKRLNTLEAIRKMSKK